MKDIIFLRRGKFNIAVRAPEKGMKPFAVDADVYGDRLFKRKIMVHKDGNLFTVSDFKTGLLFCEKKGATLKEALKNYKDFTRKNQLLIATTLQSKKQVKPMNILKKL